MFAHFFCNSVCPNCEHDPCKHGKMVREEFDEFKDGLEVMYTIAELNDCSAKVTKDIGESNMRVTVSMKACLAH